MDNFDNKRGQENLEHLDIIKFTKAEISEEPESTKGEICIKKPVKTWKHVGGLWTNA